MANEPTVEITVDPLTTEGHAILCDKLSPVDVLEVTLVYAREELRKCLDDERRDFIERTIDICEKGIVEWAIQTSGL